MENNILNEIKPVAYRKNFESEYCYVVGVKYGSEGIMPANAKCDVCCMSSSGGSACGGFHGASQLNDDVYIVRCANDMKCYDWKV